IPQQVQSSSPSGLRESTVEAEVHQQILRAKRDRIPASHRVSSSNDVISSPEEENGLLRHQILKLQERNHNLRVELKDLREDYRDRESESENWRSKLSELEDILEAERNRNFEQVFELHNDIAKVIKDHEREKEIRRDLEEKADEDRLQMVREQKRLQKTIENLQRKLEEETHKRLKVETSFRERLRKERKKHAEALLNREKSKKDSKGIIAHLEYQVNGMTEKSETKSLEKVKQIYQRLSSTGLENLQSETETLRGENLPQGQPKAGNSSGDEIVKKLREKIEELSRELEGKSLLQRELQCHVEENQQALARLQRENPENKGAHQWLKGELELAKQELAREKVLRMDLEYCMEQNKREVLTLVEDIKRERILQIVLTGILLLLLLYSLYQIIANFLV
ncbi:hypothetical protein SK128_020767, partial [Halocaridina rubra]